MLLEKYAPKTLEEFIGNDKQKIFAKKWIEDFNNGSRKTKPILLITGDISYGKTTFAKLLLKKYKYDPIFLSSIDKRNPKMIREMIDKVMTNVSIFKILSEYDTGLIIDELESICTSACSTEKSSMTELIDIIKKSSKSDYISKPMICITNTIYDKKIKKILKYVEHIHLYKPSSYSFSVLIKKIAKKENINIDTAGIEVFSNNIDEDYRQFLYNFEDMICNVKQPFDFFNVTEYIKSIYKKDKVYETYDIVRKLLSTDLDIKTSFEYTNTDNKNISYIIHQNYPEAIFKADASTKTKINSLIDISEDLLTADTVNEYIFSNQDWDLRNYVGFLTSVKPNYIISKMKRKTSYIPDLKSSTLLVKKSQYGSNKKSIGNTLYYLNTYECSLACRYELDLLQTYNLAQLVIYNLFNENGDINIILKFMNRFKLNLALDTKKNIKVKPLEALLKLVNFEGNSIPVKTKYNLREIYMQKNT